ncbi:TonB family protein [Hyphococcus formosus]|uniref:TonB family protein n=1 Tax=Hyphococcus formosus TaxID=3143534 RepID=UPI00398B74FE
MAQDKAADVIDFSAPREAAANDGETVGVFLAASRIAAGISIEELSDAIKVKATHLQSIEAMRPDLLPPLPYVIGFVKAYARHLGLDADEIADRYRVEAGGATPVPLNASPSGKSAIVAKDGAQWVSIFAVLAITLFVAWVIFQILLGGGREEATPVVPEKRVTLGAPIDAPTTARPVKTAEQSAEAQTQTPQAVPVETAAVEPDPVKADTAGPTQDEAGPTDIETPPQSEAVVAVVEPVTTPEETRAEAPTEQIVSRERAPLPRSEPSSIITPEPTAPVAQSVAQRTQITPPTGDRVRRALPRRPTPAAPKPVITPAELLRSSAPRYPDRCAGRAVALETVTVNFDVNTEGRVSNAKIASSTNECFNNEALRTLTRWRFEPKTVDGKTAIDTGKTATLNFRR